MDIAVVIGFCIAAAVICSVSQQASGEIKIAVLLAAVLAVFLKSVQAVSEITSRIESLFSLTNMDGQYLKILFKGLGICYITQIAADFCRDCGENALASQAELAGKISLLIISMPLFSTLAEIVKELLI